MLSSRSAWPRMSAASTRTPSSYARSASFTWSLICRIPTKAVLNSRFSVERVVSMSVSISRNSLRSRIMFTVKSTARIAVNAVWNSFSWWVRRTPDGEDEDRPDENVPDRVGEIEQFGGRAGLPDRPQPKAPGGRGQGDGDDQAVEPDAPAGRRTSRVAPEGANAGDRKRHRRQEPGVRQGRVRHPYP